MRSYLRLFVYKWAGKSILAILDQGLFSLSSFIVNILLARWLVPESYGAYCCALSVFYLMLGCYNALFLEPMTIFGSNKYFNSKLQYLQKLIKFHIIWSIGCMILLTGIVGIILIEFPLIKNAVQLANAFLGLGMSVGMILFFFLIRRFWYLDHQVKRALQGTFIYISFLLVGVWCIYSLRYLYPITVFIVSGLSGLLAGIISLLISLKNDKNLQVKRNKNNLLKLKNIVVESWNYGSWLIISALFIWLNNYAYYLLTANILGLSETGALRALQNLTSPIIQILVALGLLFMPWASKRYVLHDKKVLMKKILLFSIISTVLSLMYWLFLIYSGDFLLDIAYKGKYSNESYLLIYIGIVPVVISLTYGWMIGLRVLGKTYLVFIADSIGAFLTLTGGIVLIKLLGLIGAVLGIILSNLSRIVLLPFLWNKV